MERHMSEVEALLRKQAFSNPDHKEKLRRRLADLGTEICDEDLGRIAGGTDSDPLPDFESWIKI